MRLNDLDIFSLGPCALYAAAGEVSSDGLRAGRYYAGVSDGGVLLKYSRDVHEVKDESGEVVCELSAGERLTLSGRLHGISLSAWNNLRGIGEDGSRERFVSVLIVSPVSSEDEVTLYLKCSPSPTGDASFEVARSGGLSFKLTSVGGQGKLSIGEV